MKKLKGFTLIELIVVIILLSVLVFVGAGIISPKNPEPARYQQTEYEPQNPEYEPEPQLQQQTDQQKVKTIGE